MSRLIDFSGTMADPFAVSRPGGALTECSTCVKPAGPLQYRPSEGDHMRALGICVVFLTSVALAAAQAPAARQPATAPRPAVRSSAAQPDGDLAQLMRGILFPNSNILFDVQENDPGAPPKKPEGDAAGPGASHSYANVYDGWQVVE